MDFYTQNGFKLFPCKMDKSPNISTSGIGWRDPEAHLTQSEAEELAARGNLIGAWIPDNMIVIDIDRNHFSSVEEGNLVRRDASQIETGITDGFVG